MRDAVRLAVGTLTRWPVTPPTTVDRRTARDAMLLAPWVGLALGVLASVIAWVAGQLGGSPLVVAVLVLVLLALATRGLHLDGLADTADGLGSGRGAADALEIMRRSDLGPIGAATLVLTLMVQAAALDQVLTRHGPVVLGALVAASRLALPVACTTTVPAARSGGLGAAVAGSVPLPAAVLDFLLVAAVAAGAFTLAGAGPLAGVQVCAAGLIATTLTIRVTRRRLGGITGDVLGAAVELALAAGLLTAVLRPA